jgi:hypothetical protein
MRTLNPDETRRLLGKELQQLRSPDLPPHNDLACSIDPVHLEDRLGDIQTYRDHLTHGSPPPDRRRLRSCRKGAPSTASGANRAMEPLERLVTIPLARRKEF